jgi:hypothetical protein
MNKRLVRLTAALMQFAFATVTGAVDSQTTERAASAAEIEAIDALPRSAVFDAEPAKVRGEPGT